MAKLDFIENPEAEETVAAEVVETPLETVTPEVVAPAEVAPEPVEAAKPEGVPLPTFLDMRDKLKAAERRAAEAEARATPEPTVQIPDIFEDPDGHNAAIQAQIDARLYQQSLVMSERFAVQQYGGTPGLIEGNAHQVLNQLVGIGTVIVYDGIVSFIILKVVDVAIGLRVTDEVERDGLDLALHGEVVQ